jgi:hypothetical protein
MKKKHIGGENKPASAMAWYQHNGSEKLKWRQ